MHGHTSRFESIHCQSSAERSSRQEGGAARGRVSSWFITPAPDFTKEKGGEPCWFLIKPLCLCSFTLRPSSDGLPDFLSLPSDLLEPFLLSPLAGPGPAVGRPPSHPPCCPRSHLQLVLLSPPSIPSITSSPKSALSILLPFLCLSWALPAALSPSTAFLCSGHPTAHATNGIIIATQCWLLWRKQPSVGSRGLTALLVTQTHFLPAARGPALQAVSSWSFIASPARPHIWLSLHL